MAAFSRFDGTRELPFWPDCDHAAWSRRPPSSNWRSRP